MKQEELYKILYYHKLWVESKGKKGAQANLSGVLLKGANLKNTNLNGANLSDANLGSAHLEGACLDNVVW